MILSRYPFYSSLGTIALVLLFSHPIQAAQAKAIVKTKQLYCNQTTGDSGKTIRYSTVRSLVPVVLVIIAFNFFGDGLRDAADPYK